MLVRALDDHYDPTNCRRSRGQVFDYHGPMHKYIAPAPLDAGEVFPLPPAHTPAGIPLDVQQRLAALRGASLRPPTSEPIDPHLTPTPPKSEVVQLPSGALPPDLVPLPPSMPLPASMPAAPIPSVTTAVDDGRDLLG